MVNSKKLITLAFLGFATFTSAIQNVHSANLAQANAEHREYFRPFPIIHHDDDASHGSQSAEVDAEHSTQLSFKNKLQPDYFASFPTMRGNNG